MSNGCKLTSEDALSQKQVGHKMWKFRSFDIFYRMSVFLLYCQAFVSFPPKGLGREVNDQLVSASASPFARLV